METFGNIIRKLREEKKLPLREVAVFLHIDQAILSKVERGKRRLTKQQVIKLATFYKVIQEDLLVAWLSDKLVYEVEDEALALKALQMAEEKVAYLEFKKIDRKALSQKIVKAIKKFSMIEKAWIYGSFAREDDGPKSDIDIAIETKTGFSYFDLADVQNQLEQLTHRKVDVGFMDSFKPYILERVKSDLKLIYERST